MEYSYKVKTRDGEVLEGVIGAENEDTAVNMLHSRGYVLLSLNSASKNIFSADINHIFTRVTKKDIVIFTRQLAILMDADTSINEGLRILSRQVEKPVFQNIISDIADEIEGGSSLSSAFEKYPKLFSSFYIKIVESGEASGKLHYSLTYLADYLERSQAITAKFRGALAYPAFIVFAMVIVGIIMTVFVMPQLLSILEEAKVEELPFTTTILIAFTGFVNENIIFLAVLGAIFIGLFVYYAKTPEGKHQIDDWLIGFPVVGFIFRNLYLARMAEGLSAMIKSGIPILEAMNITAGLVGNNTYKNIILEAEENVKSGGKMSESFARYKEIPPLFSSMIAIGERSGKIDFILTHIANFYKSESEVSISAISEIIEPVIVFILGIGVAVLISSILLPIYSLVGA
jgi:type II secretory pathway component PulF